MQAQVFWLVGRGRNYLIRQIRSGELKYRCYKSEDRGGESHHDKNCDSTYSQKQTKGMKGAAELKVERVRVHSVSLLKCDDGSDLIDGMDSLHYLGHGYMYSCTVICWPERGSSGACKSSSRDERNICWMNQIDWIQLKTLRLGEFKFSRMYLLL